MGVSDESAGTAVVAAEPLGVDDVVDVLENVAGSAGNAPDVMAIELLLLSAVDAVELNKKLVLIVRLLNESTVSHCAT